MRIETFIRQNILALRLAGCGVLVVHDPARGYRALCQERTIEHGLENGVRNRPARPKSAPGRKEIE